MIRITANQLAHLADLQRDRAELMPVLRTLRSQPDAVCEIASRHVANVIKITGREVVAILEARKARIDDALRETGLEVAGE